MSKNLIPNENPVMIPYSNNCKGASKFSQNNGKIVKRQNNMWKFPNSEKNSIKKTLLSNLRLMDFKLGKEKL